MSGTLRADWICGEEQLGFEFHRILHCKFTFTPEMGAKPLLNDVYKRLPANVTKKLRNPHIGQVFDGSFGRCLHFSETNIAHKFVQKDGDIQSIMKRTVCIVFSNKRRFARSPGDVDEENGVFLTIEPIALRDTVLTPSTRRAFFTHWINFAKKRPLGGMRESSWGLAKNRRRLRVLPSGRRGGSLC